MSHLDERQACKKEWPLLLAGMINVGFTKYCLETDIALKKMLYVFDSTCMSACMCAYMCVRVHIHMCAAAHI